MAKPYLIEVLDSAAFFMFALLLLIGVSMFLKTPPQPAPCVVPSVEETRVPNVGVVL